MIPRPLPGLLLLAATVALASPSPRREGGRAAAPLPGRPAPALEGAAAPLPCPPGGMEGGVTLEPLLRRIRAAVWRWLGLCRILLPRFRG